LPGATLHRERPRGAWSGVVVQDSERALVPVTSEPAGPRPGPDGGVDLDRWAARGLADQRRARELTVRAARALIAAMVARIDLRRLTEQVIDEVDPGRRSSAGRAAPWPARRSTPWGAGDAGRRAGQPAGRPCPGPAAPARPAPRGAGAVTRAIGSPQARALQGHRASRRNASVQDLVVGTAVVYDWAYHPAQGPFPRVTAAHPAQHGHPSTPEVPCSSDSADKGASCRTPEQTSPATVPCGRR
jgi:hypothetical protein